MTDHAPRSPATGVGFTHWARTTEARSRAVGLAGLTVMGIAGAAFFAIGVFILNQFTSGAPQNLAMFLMVVGIICLPLTISLAVGMFIPLMMPGRLIVRFLIAWLVVSPIYVGLLMFMTVVRPSGGGVRVWVDVGVIIASYTLGIACVVITVQWFSRRQLRFGPRRDPDPRRSSVVDLMELMTIVAVTVALVRRLPNLPESMWLVMTFGALLGAGSALGLIRLLIAAFTETRDRRDPRFRRRLLVPWVVTCLLAGAFFTALTQLEGQSRDPVEFAVAIIGTAAIVGSLAFALIWAELVFLKHFGWWFESATHDD